jgi:hypothetical protein
MAFDDLIYGWKGKNFNLRDIRVFTKVEVEELDSDGKWFAYLSLDDSDDKSQRPLRYKYSRRRLVAKASIPDDIYSDLLLGVPEDKKRESMSDSKLDFIILEIGEELVKVSGEKPPAAPDILGSISYFAADEYADELIFARFTVSTEVFDYIEKMANQSNRTLTAYLEMKCWHWLGPIGDLAIYIAKDEKSHPVYLSKLAATVNKPTISQGDQDAKTPEVTLAHLAGQVTGLQEQIATIKTAVWITAVSAAIIALMALLR